MNKQTKLEILKACRKGIISKVEVKELIQADGKILLDLSSQSSRLNPIESILDKIPEVKRNYERIIYLGLGSNETS